MLRSFQSVSNTHEFCFPAFSTIMRHFFLDSSGTTGPYLVLFLPDLYLNEVGMKLSLLYFFPLDFSVIIDKRSL